MRIRFLGSNKRNVEETDKRTHHIKPIWHMLHRFRMEKKYSHTFEIDKLHMAFKFVLVVCRARIQTEATAINFNSVFILNQDYNDLCLVGRA